MQVLLTITQLVEPYWGNFFPVFKDLNIILSGFAAFAIFTTVFNLIKKISGTKIDPATNGFIFLMISIGIFLMFFSITLNYPTWFQEEIMGIFSQISIFTFLTGLIVFIICTSIGEKDLMNEPKVKINIIKLTFIIVLVSIGSIFITLFYPYLIIIPFLIICPYFLIISYRYFNRFNKFKIIAEKKPTSWMLSGFFPLLLGLLLYTVFFHVVKNDLKNPVTLIIIYSGSISILLGGIIMNHGWAKLPNLSNLDWLLNLKQLMVIHSDSSIRLYKYPFKENEKEPMEDMGDLSATAFSAVDMVIGNILSSDDHLQTIEYGGDALLFTRMNYTVFVLQTSGYFDELRYRLENFGIEFERFFEGKLKGKYNYDIDEYQKASKLLNKYFS